MKLSLNTVNFGKNLDNRLEISKILDLLKKYNIYHLETSPLYHSSEKTLGEYNIEDFDILTTTPKIDYTISKNDNFELFKNTFYNSQKKLGYIELDSLVFPDGNDLLSNYGLTLWDLISDFKDKEYVRKIGVRVKSTDELIKIIDTVDIDIVQLPLNLIDHRFVGILKELKQKHVEIHSYSTFLQGILLLQNYEIPHYFNEIKQILEKIPNPKMAFALSFPKLIKEIDKITVAIASYSELQTIIQMYNLDVGIINYEEYKITADKYLLPNKFNKYIM